MEEAKNRLINVFNNKDYTNALTIVKEVLAEYPSLLNEVSLVMSLQSKPYLT